MAHVYDYLHDSIGIFGIPFCIPGWDTAGLFLMNIQLSIALAVGLCACLYIIKRIITNFSKSNADAKCDGCNTKKDNIQFDR